MRAREFVSRATGHQLVAGFGPEDFKCWYDPAVDYFTTVASDGVRCRGVGPDPDEWERGLGRRRMAKQVRRSRETSRAGIVRRVPGRAGGKDTPQPGCRYLCTPVAGAVTTPGFAMVSAGRISSQNLAQELRTRPGCQLCGVFQQDTDPGFLLNREPHHQIVPEVSPACGDRSELALLDHEVLRMDRHDPVSEHVKRFTDDPFLLGVVFGCQQVDGIEDDLQIGRADLIQHPPHLPGCRHDMRGDPFDADKNPEPFRLGSKLRNARRANSWKAASPWLSG